MFTKLQTKNLVSIWVMAVAADVLPAEALAKHLPATVKVPVAVVTNIIN
jgi:hypothetical protein